MLFDLPPALTLPVDGETARYPVGRIFCVGRNYAAHAAEMGSEVDREAPFYFTKAATHAVGSGETAPYPPGTSNYHHEMELAVTLGDDAFRVPAEDAMQAVHGYACALDMTRRDRQQDGKDKRRPWDLGKDVEGSAVIGTVTPRDRFEIGTQRIWLSVDGEVRQDATLDELIHSVPEIIADLSKYYHLRPGDVILTGTPAGVGPVSAGQVIAGGIDGLRDIALTIGPLV
ncbi:MAG: fumarylacetoacetate hydrolase family protein [Pseudomonadota bacterium]